MNTTTAAHRASPGVRAAALTLTTAVAIGAFAVSFHALSDFAACHAVPAQLAWIWAVVVDATILAGTLAHVALPDARRPKVIFFGGTAVSIAANAARSRAALMVRPCAVRSRGAGSSGGTRGSRGTPARRAARGRAAP